MQAAIPSPRDVHETRTRALAVIEQLDRELAKFGTISENSIKHGILAALPDRCGVEELCRYLEQLSLGPTANRWRVGWRKITKWWNDYMEPVAARTRNAIEGKPGTVPIKSDARRVVRGRNVIYAAAEMRETLERLRSQLSLAREGRGGAGTGDEKRKPGRPKGILRATAFNRFVMRTARQYKDDPEKQFRVKDHIAEFQKESKITVKPERMRSALRRASGRES